MMPCRPHGLCGVSLRSDIAPANPAKRRREQMVPYRYFLFPDRGLATEDSGFQFVGAGIFAGRDKKGIFIPEPIGPPTERHSKG